jgi:hypothetical protein
MPKEEKMFVYYKDPECREPVYSIEFKDPVVIGREKAELVVYAKNVSRAELYELEFVPKDKDLKIEKSDRQVMPEKTIMLKFVFTPSEDRKTELDTEFSVTAKGIIRAKRE